MKKRVRDSLKKFNKFRKKADLYTRDNLTGLFILNLIVLLMVLLNTADYFKPFFFLSINMIVFITLILSIFLLKVSSRVMILISILFWIFAAFLKSIRIDVWAERVGVYGFQSLLLGIILSFLKKK